MMIIIILFYIWLSSLNSFIFLNMCLFEEKNWISFLLFLKELKLNLKLHK